LVQLKESVMRRFSTSIVGGALGALVIATPPTPAQADWLGTEFLRGALEGYTSWDGFNAGAHFGSSSMTANFGNAASDEVAYILRNTTLETEIAPSNWTTLGSSTTNSVLYGGFIGYNWQWNQAVIGLDLGYSRFSSLATDASDSIERIVTTSDNVSHDVTITAQSSAKLVDYAALRGRFGYAFGRFNYANSATVTDVWTPSGGSATTFGPITQSDAQDNAFAAGFVLGVGMDVALTPNLFLRGEWEYVGFGTIGGIRTDVNVARAGLGVRF